MLYYLKLLNLFQKQTLLKISKKDHDVSKDPDKTDCMSGQKEERHDEESRKVDHNEHMPPDTETKLTKSVLASPDKKTGIDGNGSTLSITLSSAKTQKHDVEKRNGKNFVQESIKKKNEQLSMSNKKLEVGDLEISKSNSENTQNEKVKNLSEKNQQNSQMISSSEKSAPCKDLETMGEECNKSKLIKESNCDLSDVSSLKKNPVKDKEVVVDIKDKLAVDVKPKSTILEEKSNKVAIWIIFITLLFYQ